MFNTTNDNNQLLIKWNHFLDMLSTEDEFDCSLKGYLEAIKYVSEIELDDLSEETREVIDKKIYSIVVFLESYKESYYELGLVVGFRTNDQNRLRGRDYYYYIADQKMKAAVYYVRYLNFIDAVSQEDRQVKVSLDEAIEIFVAENRAKLDAKDWTFTEENLDERMGRLLNVLENTDTEDEDLINDMQLLRRVVLNYRVSLKARNNINYMKYMMFNNMMREISYVGAAYQYLWHWRQYKANLYRYVSYTGVDSANAVKDTTKKAFFAKMFEDVISHMNKSSGELCSYSKDPYIDIYKYLKIKPSGLNKYDTIYRDDEISISIQSLENSEKTRFEILKGIMVNSVKRNGKAGTFYEFIQDGKQIDDRDELAYSVEPYPELEGEKNQKNTTRKIKEYLSSYLSMWGNIDEALRYYVADDKEVVTKGNIADQVYNVNVQGIPVEFVDGYKYTMEFAKDEVIYLLLQLYKHITGRSGIEQLIEKIHISFGYTYYLDGRLASALSKPEQQSINAEIRVIKDISLPLRIDLESKFFMNDQFRKEDSNQFVTGREVHNHLKKVTEQYVRDWFKKRYEGILHQTSVPAEFLCELIKRTGAKCPPYIGTYNEFEPKKNDREICMLKHIIFKE